MGFPPEPIDQWPCSHYELTNQRYQEMDKDRIAGGVKKVTGKIKEQAGKALDGDRRKGRPSRRSGSRSGRPRQGCRARDRRQEIETVLTIILRGRYGQRPFALAARDSDPGHHPLVPVSRRLNGCAAGPANTGSHC